MLIATKDFDLDYILANKDNPQEINDYILGLVPLALRHNQAIFHNTRYYINTCVMSNKRIPMETKKRLSSILTSNMRVVGYIGDFVDCDDLKYVVNMDLVNQYYREENI